jgi:hypothetical protein
MSKRLTNAEFIEAIRKSRNEPLNECSGHAMTYTRIVLNEIHKRTKIRPGDILIHNDIEWGIVSLGTTQDDNGNVIIVAKGCRKKNGRWLNATWLPFDLPR